VRQYRHQAVTRCRHFIGDSDHPAYFEEHGSPKSPCDCRGRKDRLVIIANDGPLFFVGRYRQSWISEPGRCEEVSYWVGPNPCHVSG
jgi:hypothetical protein